MILSIRNFIIKRIFQDFNLNHIFINWYIYRYMYQLDIYYNM